MAAVSFEGAGHTYPGATEPAVRDLDLHVADGELLVLVGPSGCGKSTTLRMLAGLESVDSGTIRIGDADVTHVTPKERDIALVFQNYALYPHMTVAANMEFALKLAKVPRAERTRRVAEAAAMLDLTGYLDRKPGALSGGQRQRVAMGRAIVREPRVFLMDEPLSNLDAKLRVSTRAHISALQRRLATTMLYVTHDQVEAMTLGQRVAVLEDGVLQQCDSPRVLYDRPANAFVAGFIGSPPMNLYRVVVGAGGVTLGGYEPVVPRSVLDDRHVAANGHLIIGVRPESLRVSTSQHGMGVTVTLVEELGADAYCHGVVDSDDGLGAAEDIVFRTQGPAAPMVGETVRLTADPDALHFFSAVDGSRIEP